MKHNKNLIGIMLILMSVVGCHEEGQRSDVNQGISVLNTNKPLQVLQSQAAVGNSQAELTLGWRYHNGEGVRANEDEASNWWTKAAEQGNVKAMVALGDAAFDRWENEDRSFWATNTINPETGMPYNPPPLSTNSPNLREGDAWYQKALNTGGPNAIAPHLYRPPKSSEYYELELSKELERSNELELRLEK